MSLSETTNYSVVLPQHDPMRPSEPPRAFVVKRVQVTYLGPFGSMDAAMAAMRADFKEGTVAGHPGPKPVKR